MLIGSTNEASPQQFTSRIKASVLRRLTTAPLSEWPQALVECLDTLTTFGVCHRSALVEMLRPVIGSNGQDPAAVGARPALRSPAPEAPANLETPQSPQVRCVRSYMRTHYHEQISLDSLAKRVGRNTGYLATLFRRQTGMTIHRYLTGIRMQHAAKLLRRCVKVEAVMLLVGYRSKKNFYRQFEAAFGVTPGRYKANHSSVRGGQMPRGSTPAGRPAGS